MTDINENIENESSQERLDLVNKINMDPVKRAMVKTKRPEVKGFNDRDVLNKYISTHVMQNQTIASRYKHGGGDKTMIANTDAYNRKRI